MARNYYFLRALDGAAARNRIADDEVGSCRGSEVLTRSAAKRDNRIVRQGVSAVVAFLLTVAVATVAWADCIGEQPNAPARMKCCATAHHRCGTGTADDCCHRMEGGGPSSNVATTAIAKAKVPVAFIALGVLPSVDATPLFVDAGHGAQAFIRPHDPPHLHPFPLLI